MTTDRAIRAVWAEGMNSEGQVIIGNSETNALPWPHYPNDLKHFRETTRDHVLVMGRKTYDSLPDLLKTAVSTHERPLIVVTRNSGSQIIDATPGNLNIQPISPDTVDRIPTHALGIADGKWPGKPIAVIGGTAIIDAFRDYLTHLVVTTVPGIDHAGDVLAPDDSIFNDYSRTHWTPLEPGDSATAIVHYYLRKDAA